MPHYHVIKLPYCLRLRFEVLQTCHVMKLLCGRRFCSWWGALSASTGDTGSRPLTLLS